MVRPVDVEEASSGLRPEIASSWRRSQLSGLDPYAPLGRISLSGIDTASRLMVAANPVLDDMARTLEQTRFCVILADRDSRIVGLRYGEKRVEAAMEHTGAVQGRLFSEEMTGTNSIATPYEIRRGVAVHGDEHYLESFKKFSCYGHPIQHPVTHRLEGVLDITCLAEEDNPLLAPFLIRAARDIETRLLEGSRVAEHRMLASYQAAVRRRTRPVLVLGDGVVLANPPAVDLLEASDHAVLRALSSEVRDDRRHQRDVPLACGATVRVGFERIPGGGGGVLFELDEAPGRAPGRRTASRDDTMGRIRDQRLSVMVTGEPGSGRTTVVRELAGGEPVRELSATQLTELGPPVWLSRLAGSLREPGGITALEDVHLLPASTALRAARLLEAQPAWAALTSTAVDQLGEAQASLAAHCVERIEVPPLRHRIDELPRLITSLLASSGADPSLRFTASALEALASHPWPGNLRELDAVVRDVRRRRSTGDVTVRDLPEAYQISARTRRLSTLEQAERDAILAALRACRGNKVHTAGRLGISRTTLYSRIRALGIVA
ncbi:MAG: sigma-54-dependent Fis family transcriptional regulator [Micromonosporaceae bacterium]